MHGRLSSILTFLLDIVLSAAYDIEQFGHLTRGSLSAIDGDGIFNEHLIYSILHEPIYCEG